MTHSFSFTYHNRAYYFMWDSESGSLHNVDFVTFLIAKDRFEHDLDEDQLKALKSIDEKEVKEINEELDELVKEGVLDSPCTCTQDCKKVGEIKALCLHICHDCNLKCRYCFADEGTYHTRSRAHMSFEVGKNAIDFLVQHSGKRHNLEVDFFGGEPLMNFDVVKQIVEYARSIEKDVNKKFSFTMTTNCILLSDDKIEWLNKEMNNVVLSIDGRKDINDAVRKTVSGKSAFDVILNNALKMKKARGNKTYYVRGTYTAKNLDFCKDVEFLNDAGFDQISMEPVVTDIPDLKITKEMLPTILKEYEHLAEVYIDRRKTDKWFNFFHYMIDIESGPCVVKRLTGCGAGCEYLAVTPTGDIFPCHQFAENKDYYMGNVFDKEINMDISKKFAQNIVTKKPACDKCPAKYYCSGGCTANNINYAGSMQTPYEITCALERKRMDLSLAIKAIEGAAQE